MLVHNTLSSFNELLTLLSIPGITFGFSEKFRFMMLDKINALLAEYVNIYLHAIWFAPSFYQFCRFLTESQAI